MSKIIQSKQACNDSVSRMDYTIEYRQVTVICYGQAKSKTSLVFLFIPFFSGRNQKSLPLLTLHKALNKLKVYEDSGYEVAPPVCVCNGLNGAGGMDAI